MPTIFFLDAIEKMACSILHKMKCLSYIQGQSHIHCVIRVARPYLAIIGGVVCFWSEYVHMFYG